MYMYELDKDGVVTD